MEENVEVLLWIAFVLVSLFVIFYWSMKRTPKVDPEADGFEDDFEDDYILDKESGLLFTISEAESGNYDLEEVKSRKLIGDERYKYYIPDEVELLDMQDALESQGVQKIELTDDEIKKLASFTLAHYRTEDAFISVFQFPQNRFRLILPRFENDGDNQYYPLIWFMNPKLTGNYFFRPKTIGEQFTDKFRNDDEIRIENYECFVNSKAFDIQYLEEFARMVLEEGENRYIEVNDGDALIKVAHYYDNYSHEEILNLIAKFSYF